MPRQWNKSSRPGLGYHMVPYAQGGTSKTPWEMKFSLKEERGTPHEPFKRDTSTHRHHSNRTSEDTTTIHYTTDSSNAGRRKDSPAQGTCRNRKRRDHEKKGEDK